MSTELKFVPSQCVFDDTIEKYNSGVFAIVRHSDDAPDWLDFLLDEDQDEDLLESRSPRLEFKSVLAVKDCASALILWENRVFLTRNTAKLYDRFKECQAFDPKGKYRIIYIEVKARLIDPTNILNTSLESKKAEIMAKLSEEDREILMMGGYK